MLECLINGFYINGTGFQGFILKNFFLRRPAKTLFRIDTSFSLQKLLPPNPDLFALIWSSGNSQSFLSSQCLYWWLRLLSIYWVSSYYSPLRFLNVMYFLCPSSFCKKRGTSTVVIIDNCSYCWFECYWPEFRLWHSPLIEWLYTRK